MEYRAAHEIEVRADGDAKGRVTITPMPYGVLDTYNTRFRAGCFTKYLETNAPVFAWAHDQTDPIGQMVDFDDDAKRLRMNMQLDDFEAVPRARQAYSQLRPHPATGRATLRNVSVGFDRKEWEPMDDDTVDFVRCDLPEVSVVMAGAVPGASVDGVRSGATMIARQDAIDVAMRLHRGEIGLDEAILTIYGERAGRGVHSHAKQDGTGHTSHSHVDGNGTHAHSGLMPTTPRAAAPPVAAEVEHLHPKADGSGMVQHAHPDGGVAHDHPGMKPMMPMKGAMTADSPEVAAALDIAARYR